MIADNRRSLSDFSESSWSVLAATRFVLACIVLASHVWCFTPDSRLFAVLGPFGGTAAVLGFLLISGVSIAHSYKERPDGYFARRFLRIYPLYFVAVCFAGLLLFILGHTCELEGTTLTSAGWKTSVANLFLLQGFAAIAVTYNPPLWSLSVEVFYYLMVPLFIRCRPWVLICLVVVSMVLFQFYFRLWLFGYYAARFAWPWLIGFLFVYKRKSMAAAVLAAAGVVMVVLNKNDATQVLSWVTFAAAATAVFLAGFFSLPRKVCTVFNFLGEQSYPLYLFHVPLCIAFYKFAGIRNEWAFVALVFLSTAILNQVFDHWLKRIFWKPVLKLVLERISLPRGR